MAGIEGLVDVGEGLCFDPLARIHHQKGAFDGPHGPADFVGEIDVAGGVDQVQDIGFAILRRIFDPHRVGLDRDAAFAFDIHAVQHLRLHIARSHRSGHLNEPVGKGGFSVVNMGHDREIADEIKLGHAGDITGCREGGKGVVGARGVHAWTTGWDEGNQGVRRG